VNRTTFGAFVFATLLGLHALAGAAPDAQAVLAASDAVRNPGKPFAVTVTLIEYRSNWHGLSSEKFMDGDSIFRTTEGHRIGQGEHVHTAQITDAVGPGRDDEVVHFTSGREIYLTCGHISGWVEAL